MTDYIFPPDLEKTPVRFMINTRRFVPFSKTAKGVISGKSPSGETLTNKNYYILPIPQQGINDVFNMIYDTQSLGAVGGSMSTLQNAIRDINKGDFIQAGIDVARGGLELLSQRGITQLAKTVGARATGVTLAQVQSGIEQLLGVVENPNFAALFKGVRLRNHNFQWKFLPRNLTESTLIGNLIRQLQADALPSTATLTDEAINGTFGGGKTPPTGWPGGSVNSKGSNFVLGYPDVAFLKIIGPSYDLITFNKDGSFISDIRVSYSEGEVAFFKDKYHPSEVTLSIQFVERTIVTKNDFISRLKTNKGTAPLSDLIKSDDTPRLTTNVTGGGTF